MIREYACWVVRCEAWWASGNALFGPPGATEMRVTTSELASFSISSPQKAGMLVCFWRSSFNKQAAAFLTHFFLPLFLSLLFGGKGWWKEKKKVKYLGWSCDDAGNTTVGHWPPISWAQRWGHPAGSWAPVQPFPEPGSCQSLPFKN